MKEKILQEAERLFWKYGVRSITMDDIAKRLGISKKTIYQHFTDKEDIVWHVTQFHIEGDRHKMSCLRITATNPIEEMLKVSELMRQNADEINPTLMMDVQRYYPKAWNIWLRYKEEVIVTAIADNLRKGIRQGLYRADIDPEVMARLRIELVQLGFSQQVFPTDRLNVMDIQEQLLHHFIRGILTAEGFTVYNNLKAKGKEYNANLYENK